MKQKPVSAPRAKDKAILVDLDDMALAMHADATFMTDAEYAAAQARLAKRRQILASIPDPDHKARRKELIDGLTAIAFLAVSAVAIVYTIVNWNWQ